MEFLSHLRQDVDPEFYQSVDGVIHQLLSLPQEAGAQHEQWCLYKTNDTRERDQQYSEAQLSAGEINGSLD